MRVPLAWLEEFVTVGMTPSALAERLTMAGLEIESIEEVGRLDRRIRTGRILDVTPHPDADGLHVCRVDTAEGAPIQVVSGAPGLAADQVVAVALPGARLPDGREMAAVELRGVASAGMLCSETELGLGEDASRVLELTEEAPGTPLVDVAGVVDTVIAVEVTPNRGDWLSILGVAREIAAVTGAKLRHPRPRPREAGGPAAQDVRVRVEDAALCPRYCARLVRAVRPGPSPFWLRLRLQRAGMRPIDSIVDATNYVMLERGQPLHAFDFERIAGARSSSGARSRASACARSTASTARWTATTWSSPTRAGRSRSRVSWAGRTLPCMRARACSSSRARSSRRAPSGGRAAASRSRRRRRIASSGGSIRRWYPRRSTPSRR